MSNLEPIGKCWYCGVELYDGKEVFKQTGNAPFDDDREVAQKDHVVPKSRGGSNATSNTVLACRSCNSKKRDKTLEEFRYYLMCDQDTYEAARHLMQVARLFDLPESGALQRAAGRLLDRSNRVEFYGEQ